MAFGQKSGIPVNFFHDNTGAKLSYHEAKALAHDAARRNSWVGKVKSWFRKK